MILINQLMLVFKLIVNLLLRQYENISTSKKDHIQFGPDLEELPICRHERSEFGLLLEDLDM